LTRTGWAPVTFAFHGRDEIGSVMLAKSEKSPGLNLKASTHDPFGAGHGIRTRDPELGKLVLYQLS
jgi:hypothetical protein